MQRFLVLLYPFFIIVGGLIIILTDHGPEVHCIVCNGKAAFLQLGDPLMTIIGAVFVAVGLLGAVASVMTRRAGG